MQQAAQQKHTAGKLAFAAVLSAGLCLLMVEPAFAAGLTKVTGFISTIQTLLQGLGAVVVSIAVMWVGYKMLFRGAAFSDVSQVLVGGILIGAAVEIAALFF